MLVSYLASNTGHCVGFMTGIAIIPAPKCLTENILVIFYRQVMEKKKNGLLGNEFIETHKKALWFMSSCLQFIHRFGRSWSIREY
jgi:hypothetical protein